MSKRKWGLVAGAMLSSAAVAAPVEMPFAAGSLNVGPGTLDLIADVVARDGSAEVVLTGETGPGAQRFDPALSAARAVKVRSGLRAMGVAVDRVEISYGPGSGL